MPNPIRKKNKDTGVFLLSVGFLLGGACMYGLKVSQVDDIASAGIMAAGFVLLFFVGLFFHLAN